MHATERPVPNPDEPHARVAALPGLGLGRSLARVRGNAATYLRLLKPFIDDHGDDPGRCTANLAARDLAGIRNIAHGLKESAGNLAATAVATAATALDSAIQQDAESARINPLGKTLTDELEQLTRQFR